MRMSLQVVQSGNPDTPGISPLESDTPTEPYTPKGSWIDSGPTFVPRDKGKTAPTLCKQQQRELDIHLRSRSCASLWPPQPPWKLVALSLLEVRNDPAGSIRCLVVPFVLTHCLSYESCICVWSRLRRLLPATAAQPATLRASRSAAVAGAAFRFHLVLRSCRSIAGLGSSPAKLARILAAERDQGGPRLSPFCPQVSRHIALLPYPIRLATRPMGHSFADVR